MHAKCVMGRRRRQQWHTHDALVKAAPQTNNGVCILAPVCNLMDIVDMCATIGFVNNYLCKEGHESRLHAHAVLTSRVDGHWQSQAQVVFRTSVGSMPCAIQGKSFTAPGSNYAVTVCEQEPENEHTRKSIYSEALSSESTIRQSVRAVSSLINEHVDPRSLPFRNAVLSRLRMFMRYHVNEDSVTPPDLSTGDHSSSNDTESESDPNSLESLQSHVADMPLLISVKPRPLVPQPFKKPQFDTIEDLLQPAFATHFVDSNGHERAVPLLAPPEHLKYQPLVFCSTASSMD